MICSKHGCPTRTSGGYCDEHKPKSRPGRPMPVDWKRTRARIVKRDGGICFYCGRTGSTSCDHRVPVSQGGTEDDTNLVCSCWPCNQRKGDR